MHATHEGEQPGCGDEHDEHNEHDARFKSMESPVSVSWISLQGIQAAHWLLKEISTIRLENAPTRNSFQTLARQKHMRTSKGDFVEINIHRMLPSLYRAILMDQDKTAFEMIPALRESQGEFLVRVAFVFNASGYAWTTGDNGTAVCKGPTSTSFWDPGRVILGIAPASSETWTSVVEQTINQCPWL